MGICRTAVLAAALLLLPGCLEAARPTCDGLDDRTLPKCPGRASLAFCAGGYDIGRAGAYEPGTSFATCQGGAVACLEADASGPAYCERDPHFDRGAP